MAESSPKGYKTLWEKEKLLVTSNFSVSHGVFKKLVLQTRKNQGLFRKELNEKFCNVKACKSMNPFSGQSTCNFTCYKNKNTKVREPEEEGFGKDCGKRKICTMINFPS